MFYKFVWIMANRTNTENVLSSILIDTNLFAVSSMSKKEIYY